ncbi:MAG: HD domain-containing phosphohydrolase [Bryobacteraceae bacterium]
MTELMSGIHRNTEYRQRVQRAADYWNSTPDANPYQATILVVDDLEINRRLLGAMLRQERYRVLEARRAVEALEILEREKVDLVVLDLMMPEIDGLECCRRIKSSRKTELVPVLMLSCVQGVEHEIAGIGAGADEYLGKPFHPEVLRTRIRALLRHKLAIDSLEQSETILFTLAQAVEQRDRYTGGHCERLALFSVELGIAMGLTRWQLLALHRGGYLHDIGKVAMPDSILYKPGPLSTEEWAIMRTHTVKGEEICKPMKTLQPVLPIIRSHHERWDGTGYPDGLRGEQIPMLARVLQIADIFDALTSARPYKKTLPLSEALEVMWAETKRGWRDPELMRVFASLQMDGGGTTQAGLQAIARELARDAGPGVEPAKARPAQNRSRCEPSRII